MNEPGKNMFSPKSGEPDTTELHLGKLVPGTAQPAAEGESVTAFTAKAVAETIQESPKPVVVPRNAGALPPDSMLGAVTYCYAKGVYASSEIERKMMEDTTFRNSCGNELPRPEDIRRFRRLNREAIQATLEKVLRFARTKVAETLSPSNPFRTQDGSPRSGETQAFARREASARMEKASFIDGMSM